MAFVVSNLEVCEVTSAEMKRRELKVDVEAKGHAIQGLVNAVQEMSVG